MVLAPHLSLLTKKELGLPTGTVAIRIMRARKKLFTALQHHLGRLRRPPACFQ